MGKFLIVVDTQYDFMMSDGKLPVPGAEEIIVPMNKYLASLDPDEFMGVLFTADTHDPEIYKNSPEAEQFPIHCVKGTPGWENVFNPSLVPAGVKVYTLEKGVFNMWEEDNVMITEINNSEMWNRDDLFYEAEKDEDKLVTDVVVVGVASEFCVKWAVDGFLERGINVEIPEALTRGITRTMAEVVEQDFPGKVVLS